MSKEELMEQYTAEQLADMVVKYQNTREISKSCIRQIRVEYGKRTQENTYRSIIDKVCDDILKQKNNAMAMEFTRIIGELLRENGVYVNCKETKISENITENSIEEKYSIVFDGMDFSQHDKEFTDEIERLKCKLKYLEIKIEEEYEPLEIEIENLRKNERKLSEENAELHCELQAVNAFQEGYPTEPIKVADMLINARKKRTNCMTGKEYDKYIFEKWQLGQIAEHLLIYCNENRR